MWSVGDLVGRLGSGRQVDLVSRSQWKKIVEQ
jgi:hypothetical protein